METADIIQLLFTIATTFCAQKGQPHTNVNLNLTVRLLFS